MFGACKFFFTSPQNTAWLTYQYFKSQICYQMKSFLYVSFRHSSVHLVQNLVYYFLDKNLKMMQFTKD